MDLRSQEGGDALRTHRILQLEVVVRIELNVKNRGYNYLLSQYIGGGQESNAGCTIYGVEGEHIGSNVNRNANEDNVAVRLLF